MGLTMYSINLPEMKKPEADFTYRYITTDIQAKMVVDVLSKESIIAVDTETTGLDPLTSKVHLVQIGNPNHMFVVDAHRVNIKKILKPLLEDPKSLKILQNAVFDYKMLKYHFDIDLANIFDTMLAELTLTCGYYYGFDARKKASLSSLVNKYLKISDLDKKIRDDFPKIKPGYDFSARPDLLKYAAMDVYYPVYIYRLMRSLLIDKGLVECVKLEFDIIPVMAEMELTGVKIDRFAWEEIIADLEEKFHTVGCKIHKEFNKVKMTKVDTNRPLWDDAPSTNIASDQQVLSLLLAMGYKIENTDHYTLLEYQQDDIIKLILEYRKYSKMLTSYGKTTLAKLNHEDGRLRGRFDSLGAAQTGRMSSSDPNLQQVPTDAFKLADGRSVNIRDCFIPKDGYVFVGGDFSQQEVRIAAHVFKDPFLFSVYNDGRDLYRMIAAMMFHKEYDDIDKKSFERQLAKTIVLASNYGGGPGPLIRNLLETGIKLSYEDALGYLKKYNEALECMNKNMRKHVQRCMNQGFVEFAMGKKRTFMPMIQQMKALAPETDEHKALKGQIERRMRNTPIQGNAALMTKLAALYTYRGFRKVDVDGKIVIIAHDEIVAEVKDSQGEIAAEILKKAMERSFQDICPGFPNKVDTSIMSKWVKE